MLRNDREAAIHETTLNRDGMDADYIYIYIRLSLAYKDPWRLRSSTRGYHLGFSKPTTVEPSWTQNYSNQQEEEIGRA